MKNCKSCKCECMKKFIVCLSSIIIAILVVYGVCVANKQLTSIKQNTENDLLLKISQRYGSGEIAQAREELHNFHEKVQETLKNEYGDNLKYGTDKHLSDKYKHLMSKQIINYSKKEGYTNLLIMLDFFETISYLVIAKSIPKNDIDQLLGTSLEYYFNVFKGYIYKRRNKYSDPSYCREFELLALDNTKTTNKLYDVKNN